MKEARLSSELPSIDSLISDLNVDYLETASWLTIGSKYGAKKAARTEVASPKNDERLMVKGNKRKRKRKVRLPKNYDPNVPPDPERWLPKYERSAYKKRKDKRAREREIGRGTQGTVTENPEAETVIFSENATSSPKSPLHGLTAGTQNIGPRQMHPAPQRPKKKKKERKS
ncbi:unnamed protein product [Soboliphyme baturini]|uniref:SRP72 domain-containing protein n=1 Tax=Soboliphyme baturini TaxID=241478 RepID=A0A183J9J1_9BILA|nr:unnamed protein product [Soboliphyme baturini]